MKIPVTRPYLDDKEKEATASVLESGWLVQGPRVAEFERLVCEYSGAMYACAATSCTTALHLALVALGVGPGDEVVVPSFTFIASANVVEYTGAKPVFVDIDLRTFNIDTDKLEAYLKRARRSRTPVRAVIPVHLFGLCADMDALMQLAKQYNLYVIEDAACALGSFYKQKHAGTFGNAGCFSFHPRKPITTGEGGMVTTNDPGIAAKVQSLRDHGAAVSDLARHEKGGSILPAFDMCGYNYRMTDIQGAIGVEQMNKFPWIVSKRIEKARIYDEHLKGIDWLQTPPMPSGYIHSYQSYVTLVREPKSQKLTIEKVLKLNKFRNEIMAKLEQRGIATRQGTHAVHTLNYYKRKYDLKDEDYFNSFAADRLSMTIPLYPQMTDEEQDYVIEQIRSLVSPVKPSNK
jgi:dTDP-4-amino-4,6-dideoxygalactose transaminase